MTVCFRCNATAHEGANFCPQCGSSLETDDVRILHASDPLLGRVLADRYRIVTLIGRGGMGVVYKGEHIHMGKPVALKLLSGELAAQKDLIKRFKREADAASRLSNIHTVTIFDYGQSQGLIYLVMEYLEGRDLAAAIRKEKQIQPLRALMVLAQVCESLGEAHDLGIIHRDLKPENIFLLQKKTQKDFVKVLDFGLAKIRADLGPPDETAHGVVLGTPYYMAPEQIKGEAIDHRSDIYSLGGLLYTMISGRPPFKAPTPLAVMAMHLTNPAPPLAFSENTTEDEKHLLSHIVQTCMSKDPSKRFESAQVLMDTIFDAAKDMASGEFSLPGTTSAPSLGTDGAALAATPTDISAAGLKEEFDRYERILRLRRFAYVLVPLLLLVAAGFGLFRYVSSMPEEVEVLEVEPNNHAAQANRILVDSPRTGYMGKRLNVTESDHDWYRLEVPLKNLLLDVTLEGVPNMDLMLQIFRKGEEKALAAATAGAVGEGEILRSLDVSPGVYYILVREDLSLFGTRATENISDLYTLTASLHRSGGWELEPNDDRDRPTLLKGGGEARGHLVGTADTDLFLVHCDSPGGVACSLTGLESIPVSLCLADLLGGTLSEVSSPSPSLSVPAKLGMEKFFVTLSCAGSEEDRPPLHAFESAYILRCRCEAAKE
jgi:serine/threonine protein kinase